MRMFLRLVRKDSAFLLLALFLSVWVVVGFSAFTERLQIMLMGESSQLLAADAVLRSPYLLDEELIQQAENYGLVTSRYASFQSMLFADDEPQLVNVKAADEGYPLKGQLEIEQQGQIKHLQAVPKQGELWAEPRLLSLLELQQGAEVSLGDADFALTAVLRHQPDQGLNLFSIGPKVLMHWQDIEQTQLIQTGSKVSYSYLFAGKAENIAQYQQDIKDQLSTSQEWLNLDSSQPTVANIVHSAQLFFLLASGAIIILASIAMAMAAKRFADKHHSTVAVLKSFGLSGNKILLYYSIALLLFGLPVYLLACGLAYFSQDYALQLIANDMQVAVPALGIKPFVLGLLCALISLISFVGPALWQLRSSSALQVLRGTETNASSTAKSTLLAFISLFVLIAVYSQTLLLSALLMLALLAAFAVLFAVFYGVLSRLLKRPRVLNHWLYLAVHQLKRFLPQHALQAAVFAISFMLLLLIMGLQDNLFKEWQKQLPDDAPNTFLVNIYPDDLEEIEDWLQEKQIASEVIYPMIRGRLISINNVLVGESFSKEEQKKASIHRELNLSWKHDLAADNVIEQGEWQAPGVSVEEQMAERLDIHLGDTLAFRIEGQEVTAQVSSIRSVDWNSMRPNFFVLLEQQDLADFSPTYMTSIRVEAEQKQYINGFIQQWPTVVLIEIDHLITQLRSIISYVALALKLILLCIIAASLLVLVLTVLNSLQQRQKENALLRVFGANKALLSKSLFAEFAVLGFVAGLVASVIALVALLVLQVFVFKLPASIQWGLLPIAPVLGVLIIGAAGWFAAAQVVNESPVSLLKAE